MTVRERLPNRRACENFNIQVDGLRYVATVGRYEDGRLGEVFLHNHKVGCTVGVMASDAAVLCSIALQHGVPLDVLRDALMRDPQGKAMGPLGVVLDRIATDHENSEAY